MKATRCQFCHAIEPWVIRQGSRVCCVCKHQPKGKIQTIRVILLLPMLMSSCVVANKNMVASLGGKGAFKSATFGLVWDHEQSFRDGTVAATALAGAYFSSVVSKAKEVTAQSANANATQQAINASNNATAVELGAQEAATTQAITIPK